MKRKIDDEYPGYERLEEEDFVPSFWWFIYHLVMLPVIVAKWVVSFFIARFVSHIVLNPLNVPRQSHIKRAYCSSDSNSDIIIVNLTADEPNKSWHDFFRGLFPRFYSHKKMYDYRDPNDKAHLDTILAQVNDLLCGTSTVKNCEKVTFQTSQIYFKGFEYLTSDTRVYVMSELSKKYPGKTFGQELDGCRLSFFSLEEPDGAVLDSVKLVPVSEETTPTSDRKFVIACLARDQNYYRWLEDFKNTAIRSKSTVVGFNYRGVDRSTGFIWTQKDMVKDVIAQVQLLLASDSNIKAENITLEGMCLGGAVATLAAAQLHDKGIKVRLYNERSFVSIPKFVLGYLLPEKPLSVWNPLRYLSQMIAYPIYLIVSTILWFVDWDMDAGAAWDNIPADYKDYSAVHDPDDDSLSDGVVHYQYASLAAREETRHKIVCSKPLQSRTETDWYTWIYGNPRSHGLKKTEGDQAERKVAHFIPRENLRCVSDPKLTGHQHFKQSFDRFFRSVPVSSGFVSRRPLIIASSGGGGHISAAQGIIMSLKNKPNHIVSVHTANIETASWMTFGIQLGNKMVSGSQSMEAWIRWIAHSLGYPALPRAEYFNAELNRLQMGECQKESNGQPLQDNGKKIPRKREYVDMLLDIYPSGYAFAAFHNAVQLQNGFIDMNHMIRNQASMDVSHYSIVFDYILKLLIDAAERDEAYTDIISTQPLSWPAMCDAVMVYNTRYLPSKNKHNGIQLPHVIVNQYVTDLPTEKCVHFIGAIQALTKEQRQQMHFHVPQIDGAHVIFGENLTHLNVTYYEPRDNVIIRSGFISQNLQDYIEKNKTHTLNLNPYHTNQNHSVPSYVVVEIQAQERVASVMLGSLASEDTVEYVLPLLDDGYHKICLFCGHGYASIYDKLNVKLRQANRLDELCKVYCLPNQNDINIAQIMTRSDAVVIRGGGLSIMEQMALPMREDKKIFIHQSHVMIDGGLSSGVLWEDGNADEMIEYMAQKGWFVEKVLPSTIHQALMTPKKGVRSPSGVSEVDESDFLRLNWV